MPLIDTLRFWAVFAISMACASLAGYAYKAHLVAIEQAKEETKQEVVTQTVERVVTVTDDAAVRRLRGALASEQARHASLLASITRERDEKDPVAVAECRISDGLRDQINADLTAAGSD